MHCLSFVQNKIVSKLGPVTRAFVNMVVAMAAMFIFPAFSGQTGRMHLNGVLLSLALGLLHQLVAWELGGFNISTRFIVFF